MGENEEVYRPFVHKCSSLSVARTHSVLLRWHRRVRVHVRVCGRVRGRHSVGVLVRLRKDGRVNISVDAGTHSPLTYTNARFVLCADAAAVSLEMDVIYATFMMCERAV